MKSLVLPLIIKPCTESVHGFYINIYRYLPIKLILEDCNIADVVGNAEAE